MGWRARVLVRQPNLTILVVIVSALVGTALARAIGIPTATGGIDWLELLAQVLVAAAGVALLAALLGRRKTSLLGSRRRSGIFR
ncbi:MAG: GlsB/YeaQ/YmgE family stress response membrane protein [Mycolicibacterium sp.]|nr:GlsB/YeaQ/YmgE family stress response membrane protein [Mycolicibacterium sp.]